MKKSKITLLFICLFIALFLFSGCGSPEEAVDTDETPDEAAETPDEPVTDDSGDTVLIGITQNNVGIDSYQTTYDRAFREEVEKRDDVEAIILDAAGDVMGQVNQIEDLMAQNVDAIIIWPVDGTAVVTGVERAYEEGFPVVITNSPIDEAGLDYIVGFSGPNNVIQGQSAAEMMCEVLEGEGKVVEIMGLPGYVTAHERSDGFNDEIVNCSGIELMETQPGDWNREKAQQVMENFLLKYDDIDGVYAADDNMAVGAINAIKEAGRMDTIKVTSACMFGDGYDAMKRGELHGTNEQSPFNDAINALEMAIDVARGKEVEFWNYFDTPKVTPEEVDNFERPVF